MSFSSSLVGAERLAKPWPMGIMVRPSSCSWATPTGSTVPRASKSTGNRHRVTTLTYSMLLSHVVAHGLLNRTPPPKQILQTIYYQWFTESLASPAAS